MPAQRFEDWEMRLHRSLLEHAQKRFAWGRHDCALAVCNHIQALTGVDPGAEMRGTYASAAAAQKVIHKHCTARKVPAERTPEAIAPHDDQNRSRPFPAATRAGFHPWMHADAQKVGERKSAAGGYTLEHLVEAIAEEHGFVEVNPRFAHRGDVVLFDSPTGPALGIVHLNGRHAAVVGPKQTRLLRVHATTVDPKDPAGSIPPARRAWRVTY